MATLGVPVTGRVAQDERAETGRAVARLDGLGLGQLLRALFAPTDTPDSSSDGGLPVALRAPVLAVLDAWAPQVDGVVWVASVTHPRLVEQLAAGVARHLGVPVVGAVGPRPGRGPGRHDVNSAQRLAGVWDRLVLDLSPAAAEGLPGRSVLLVDDRFGTGWTVTVAARLLRQAATVTVHPVPNRSSTSSTGRPGRPAAAAGARSRTRRSHTPARRWAEFTSWRPGPRPGRGPTAPTTGTPR